jgi:hypothetical protein
MECVSSTSASVLVINGIQKSFILRLSVDWITMLRRSSLLWSLDLWYFMDHRISFALMYLGEIEE